jgi:hypothetical protein
MPFHQPIMFETNVPTNFNYAPSPEAHETEKQQSSGANNTINRRPSIVIGQCPFGGHKFEVEPSAT